MRRLLKLFRYSITFFYYKTLIRSEKYYDVLYEAVSDLGGLYVKLIQSVCLRTELFNLEQKMRFLSFYDQVGEEPLDAISYLRQELGAERLKQFRSFETVPFASGTFAQVYKGQLLDGLDVVIKIKRKHLISKLRVDFFLINLFARLFDLFYYQRLINVRSFVREFEKVTYRELDYKQEVLSALYFYEHYKDHSIIKIPFTFSSLSTDTVIVQEYIGGMALTDLMRLKQNDLSEYERLLNSYQTDIKTLFYQLGYENILHGFQYDKLYADPHPGNIKVLPRNRFAIIDFGIVDSAPKNKRNYFNIFQLLIHPVEDLDMVQLGKEFLEFGANYYYKCLKVFDYHVLRDKSSLSEFVIHNYQKLLDSHKEKFREIEVQKQEDFTQVFLDIIRLGERFHVMVPPELFTLIRSIAVVKFYFEFLEPGFHPMRDVYRAVLSKVSKEGLINRDNLISSEITPEEAIETVLEVAGDIAESDLPLYDKLSRLMQGAVHA